VICTVATGKDFMGDGSFWLVWGLWRLFRVEWLLSFLNCLCRGCFPEGRTDVKGNSARFRLT
jgi:hypothetical protein